MGCSSSVTQEPPAADTSSVATPKPVPGVPYRLLVHCDAKGIPYAGRWWDADQLVGSTTPGDPYVTGTMSVLGPDQLRFDGPNGISTTFHPVPQPVGMCA